MGTDVIFTNNPGEYDDLEALYITEKDPPAFVQGVDLSRVGVLTKTVRGPTAIQVIADPARMVEVYGGRDQGIGGDIVNELWRFALNKKLSALYVRRVVAADAVAATIDYETGIDGAGTAVLRITATSAGAWGANVYWKVETATDADANHFNLKVKYLGKETLYENLDIHAAGYDNLLDVVGDDVANLVTLTKITNGRPANSSTVTETAFVALRDTDNYVRLGDIGSAYVGTDASDGSLVVGDYTTALTALRDYNGPGVVLCPESLETVITSGAQATFNAAVVTAAGLVADRIFLVWSGKTSQTAAQEITAIGTQITARTDRIVWCYNRAKTLDPGTATKVWTSPTAWMASILSQTDVDIHPGSEEASQFLAGISELENESISNGDLKLLKAAGICALEKLPDKMQFRSGVTTLQTQGKTEITRRRMADFIQLSLAGRLKAYVKGKNILERRAQMAGETDTFLDELKDANRVVENYEINQTSVNTRAQRATGLEKMFVRIELIKHMLALVLETEIGTGVVVESTTGA